MCGQVGVAGNLVLRDVTIFKELLHADFLRGVDSTGIASITHDNNVKLFKMPVSPNALMSMKYSSELLTVRSKVLMGHNRAATRGVVNIVNSHPFWTGRYMMTHNGTLDFSCLKDLAKAKDGDTDSEQLAQSIHDLGSIKDAIALAAGAWAIAVYDHQENTINLLRNDKRPLFYARAADSDTIYWASEPGMLRWILDRNNLNYDKKIYDIPVDTLFTWVIPDSKHIFNEKPTRLEAKGKSAAPFRNDAWWEQGYSQEYRGNNRTGHQGPPTASGSESKSNTAGSVRDHEHSPEYSADDIKALRAAPFSEVEWEVYGLGYCDGFGEITKNNPFHFQVDFEKWDNYEQGYKTGKEASDQMAKTKVAVVENKIDQSLPFLLGDKAEDIPKSNVILVGDLKKKPEEPKQTRIFQWRHGPNGLRISPAKFQEITKGKCSWCDEKLKTEDKGEFREIPYFGKMYVCESCLDDPDTQDSTSIPQKKA